MSCLRWSALISLIWLGTACRDDTNAVVDPSPAGPQATLSHDVGTSAALTFSQLAAGWRTTCGVTTDNRAFCWGQDILGEVGNGTEVPEHCSDVPDCITRPVAVVGGLNFRNVSTGRTLSCGVTIYSRAYCWGQNGVGELGIGDKTAPGICILNDGSETTCSSRPLAVSGGLLFRAVSTSFVFACGVTTDDRAYCWGWNTEGELGDGTTTQRSKPVAVAGGLRFAQVSVGESHACGLTTAGAVYCWGENIYGQLGDSTHVTRRLRPVRVAGGRTYRQVDAGGVHTCAVTASYRAYCWGNGQSGQLGNNKTSGSYWPRAVSGGLSFRRVTAGEAHTCAETTASRAYCWGEGGALGNGTFDTRLTPTAVAGGLLFSQVTAGAQTTCGKTSAGVAYCWGSNSDGQVGDGLNDFGYRLTPVPVASPD